MEGEIRKIENAIAYLNEARKHADSIVALDTIIKRFAEEAGNVSIFVEGFLPDNASSPSPFLTMAAKDILHRSRIAVLHERGSFDHSLDAAIGELRMVYRSGV